MRLVVTADDFGLTEGVNRAIIRAHTDGVVTAASLLAVGRAFDHAVAVVRDHPSLDVGAHLAIVGEDPPLLTAAEVPTLVDGRGRFPSTYRTVVLRAIAGRLDAEDVRREMSAQLERIRQAGVVVSHLDTHQHTHLWPTVGAVVCGLARAAEVPWVRLPTSRSAGPVGLVVRQLSRRLASRLTASGLSHTDVYAGLDEAGRLDGERFARTLTSIAAELSANGVAEVNAHPGEGDDPDLGRFAWGYHWEDELRMLTDGETRERVARHGIALTSFDELAGSR